MSFVERASLNKTYMHSYLKYFFNTFIFSFIHHRYFFSMSWNYFIHQWFSLGCFIFSTSLDIGKLNAILNIRCIIKRIISFHFFVITHDKLCTDFSVCVKNKNKKNTCCFLSFHLFIIFHYFTIIHYLKT